jgi:hypothetical protein
MLPLQMVPAPQGVLFRQHGSPGPPQDTHEPVGTPAVQRAPGSQVEPQQACPRAPQPEHRPPPQVPPVLPQDVPGAMQVPP